MSGSAPLLADALANLRLDGAIFFRSEFTESFEFESTPGVLAPKLHPGAERIILFHIVARGSCWVAAEDGERHWAREGDVIVLPYGDRHRIGGGQPTSCVPLFTLMDPPPWTTMPVVRHGGGGPRADLVCGYLYSEDPLFDPALRALPAAFVVRPPSGAAAGWVRASIDYALEERSTPDADGSRLATRLPELVLVEMLRMHLASAPAADSGWIAALDDPVLAPALACIHGTPEHKWTVAELASEVAVSRSLLDERFRAVLGRSPIRYLTEWRMHQAGELLATTELSVAEIARRVGYGSEEAFSRAFKRARGVAPTTWRHERAAPTLASPGT